ncbi:retinol dehydrogenase 14-like [Mizuhopecten yessoensis]|uniref:retinol dehydrogenase 14-like n=1 Tax=Mizuhopecten yessoensis TaxID=6573 RepID=UPI000B45B7F1|nr:retinol dehydrogenase 14-like [Mizuhopecten yessoensis]
MGGQLTFPRVTIPASRVHIITGSNTGIGYETAKWIAMLGGTVIMACRSKSRAEEAIARMNLEYDEERTKGSLGGLEGNTQLNVFFMKLDCSSLKSTMEFVDEFKKTGLKLHVLICNAGIGMHKQAFTEDENEIHFQVNYLSHFLVAAHLLPLMKRSGDDCRIVLVSSMLHSLAKFELSTIHGRQYSPRNFDRLQYYGRSKLYQIMQMYSMNRRLRSSNVTVTSLHPGVVRTELERNFKDFPTMRMGMFMAKLIGYSVTPFEGAQTTLNAAINPDLAGVRDVYFVKCRGECPAEAARNVAYQESLWKYTLDSLDCYLTDDIKSELDGNVKSNLKRGSVRWSP